MKLELKLNEMWEEGRIEGRREEEIKGRREGEARSIVNMHRQGFTTEQIAAVSEKAVEEVEAVKAPAG